MSNLQLPCCRSLPGSQSNLGCLAAGRPDAPASWGAFFPGLPSQAGAFHHPPPTSQQAPLIALGSSAPSNALPSLTLPRLGGGCSWESLAPDQGECQSPRPSNLRCSSPCWCWGSLAGAQAGAGQGWGLGGAGWGLWGLGAPGDQRRTSRSALGSSLPRSARLANVT